MSESHDPVKDAVKHLFGLDKKEEANQAAQPVEQTTPQPVAQPSQQENPADSPALSQMIGAAANLTNQAAQQMPSPQPSPTVGNPFADSSAPASDNIAQDVTATAPTNPVPTTGNPFGDNPQPVTATPSEIARQTGESQAEAHEDMPPLAEPAQVAAVAPAPVAPNPDVESINGHAVGYAFLRYYKAHPEIGQPVDEQHGNVGGYQMFENAILHWDGSNVQVENRGTQGQGSGTRTYTVNSGDNLTAIAHHFYGDGNQWHRIYDANRDKISNPDLIHPGLELVIPQ